MKLRVGPKNEGALPPNVKRDGKGNFVSRQITHAEAVAAHKRSSGLDIDGFADPGGVVGDNMRKHFAPASRGTQWDGTLKGL